MTPEPVHSVMQRGGNDHANRRGLAALEKCKHRRRGARGHDSADGKRNFADETERAVRDGENGGDEKNGGKQGENRGVRRGFGHGKLVMLQRPQKGDL